MRAKTIKFERGLNPKAAMGTGGIILEDIYIDTVQKGFREWSNFLNSLKGKKVTFYIDNSQYASKRYQNQTEAESFIIEDVNYTRDGGVTFRGENGTAYYVDTTKKIFVE